MNDLLVVLMTFPNRQCARSLSLKLVEQRLAACVNLIPEVESIYRWEGKVETSTEVLGIAKTRAENFDALKTALAEWHPYETPACVALPISAGLERYLDWIRDNT